MDLEEKHGERTTGESDVEMVDIGVARDEASPFSRFAWKRPRWSKDVDEPRGQEQNDLGNLMELY
jgi:hypothetical protein